MTYTLKKVIEEQNAYMKNFIKEHGLGDDCFDFMPCETHPVEDSAARKFKILAEPMVDFIGDLMRGAELLPKEAWKFLLKNTDEKNVRSERIYILSRHLELACPLIWDKAPNQVMVFPNLANPIISLMHSHRSNQFNHIRNANSNYARKDYVSHIKEEDALLPRYSRNIINKIKHDLNNGVHQKWNPISRGIRYLARRHSNSLNRALSRYVLLDGKPLGELYVDDNEGSRKGSWFVEVLADTIRSLNAPPTISEAHSIDEYEAMYTLTQGESPGSCMDSTHRFSLTRPKFYDATTASKPTASINEPGRPIDFYHFCPNVKGVYLHRGTVVLARTLVWTITSKNGNKIDVIGRVYADAQANRLKLKEHLEKQGCITYDDHTHDTEDVRFKIPYYEVRNREKGIPMPYFDWTPWCNVWVRSEESGMAVILLPRRAKEPSRDKGWFLANGESTAGYTVASGDDYDDEDDMVSCLTCGDSINREQDFFIEVEGEYYCNNLCVYHHGMWSIINMTPYTIWDGGTAVVQETGGHPNDNYHYWRPTERPEFVHTYSIEGGSDLGALADKVYWRSRFAHGYTNMHTAMSKGILFSLFSCAISEDIHFVGGGHQDIEEYNNIRRTLPSDFGGRVMYPMHIMRHDKEFYISMWASPSSARNNNVDSLGRSTKRDGQHVMPDDMISICSAHTKLNGIVTSYYHTTPVKIPVISSSSKIDFSKPFSFLTDDAMSSMSNNCCDVDDLFDKHVSAIQEKMGYTDNTDNLNAIITMENQQ